MKVETFIYKSNDELASNTYVVIDEKQNAVIIDPSINYDGIVDYLRNNKLKPRAVLLTHGHFDHIRGVDRLVKQFNIPLYCHFLEESLLTDCYKNCSNDIYGQITISTKPILLNDGDILKLLTDDIKVIHTPYHTEGSVCYLLLNNNILFSGDSLFKLSIGRDDLPTSCHSEKKNSLTKIFKLSNDTKVYPGHGNSTNLGYERTFNRFINR